MSVKLKKPSSPTAEKKSKSSLFTKGYGDVRSRIMRNSHYTMSCYNCEYYYQASGDKEEVCQNQDVLKYDMVVTETNIFCNRWELSRRTQSVKSFFKKKVRV